MTQKDQRLNKNCFSEGYLHIYLSNLNQSKSGDGWQQSADYGHNTANKLS